MPTSGELIYWGAMLINTNDTPTVIIIRDINNKSWVPITNVETKNADNTAVANLPRIYEGTKFISGDLLITVRLAPTKIAHSSP